MQTQSQTVVNLRSIDGTQFRMFPAERLAHILEDAKPETITVRLDVSLFRGLSRTTREESYLAQVRLKHTPTGATKVWCVEAADPDMVLETVGQFDVCRLLPDELSAVERDRVTQELKAYFERSKAKLQEEAKQRKGATMSDVSSLELPSDLIKLAVDAANKFPGDDKAAAKWCFEQARKSPQVSPKNNFGVWMDLP